jgi:CHASE2 domain-containing sensor protein
MTLEERMEQLEARNKRVEAEKAWETSVVRRVLVALLTYIVVACYLYFVIGIDPWLDALVPVVGFLLSTLTISYAKKIWMKVRTSEKDSL